MNHTGGTARLAGLALSGVVAATMLVDGATGLVSPQTLAVPMHETGFPAAMLWVVGVAAIVAGVLYAIPQTAVLGAILITAFAGGAIATHVRIGTIAAPPQIACLLTGIAAWAGLWLRDPRIRALLPTG